MTRLEGSRALLASLLCSQGHCRMGGGTLTTRICETCGEEYTTDTKHCLVCIIKANKGLFREVFYEMNRDEGVEVKKRGRPFKKKDTPIVPEEML